MNDEKLYTLKEACKILRVSRKTCSRYIAEQTLKGFRLNENGPYRIPQTALDDFVTQKSGNLGTS